MFKTLMGKLVKLLAVEVFKMLFNELAKALLMEFRNEPALFHAAKAFLIKLGMSYGFDPDITLSGIVVDKKGFKRRTGVTTRSIDRAIQSLFIRDQAFICDLNIDSFGKAEKVVAKLVKRVASEHSVLPDQMKYMFWSKENCEDLGDRVRSQKELQLLMGLIMSGTVIIDVIQNRYMKFDFTDKIGYDDSKRETED